jgi:hypothetical protein
VRAVLQWLVDGLLDNLLPAMIASPLLISAFALFALAYIEAHRRAKGPKNLAKGELRTTLGVSLSPLGGERSQCALSAPLRGAERLMPPRVEKCRRN